MVADNDMKPSQSQVILAFAAVYIIWGSTYLAIRYAVETIPPFLMGGARFLLAGTFLYAWLRLRGTPAPKRSHWKGASVVGFLMLVGGNGGVVWAEQYVPSGLTALLVATVPLWLVVLDWLQPGGTAPGGRVISGLLLGMMGIVLLIGPGNVSDGNRVDTLGATVLVMASLSWAIGSLYSRKADLPSSSLLATAMEMLAGGAFLILLALATGEAGRLDLSQVSIASAISLVYLVLFGSLIGFTAYIWLLKVTTPSRVGTYAFVNPVVAVVLGWLVAGEALSVQTVIAAAVIVASVAIIILQRSQGSKSATPKEQTSSNDEIKEPVLEKGTS